MYFIYLSVIVVAHFFMLRKSSRTVSPCKIHYNHIKVNAFKQDKERYNSKKTLNFSDLLRISRP